MRSDRVAQLQRFELNLGGLCFGLQPLALQNGLQLETDCGEPDRFAVEGKRLLHALERTLSFEKPVVCFAHLLGDRGASLGQLGRFELPFQTVRLDAEPKPVLLRQWLKNLAEHHRCWLARNVDFSFVSGYGANTGIRAEHASVEGNGRLSEKLPAEYIPFDRRKPARAKCGKVVPGLLNVEFHRSKRGILLKSVLDRLVHCEYFDGRRRILCMRERPERRHQ